MGAPELPFQGILVLNFHAERNHGRSIRGEVSEDEGQGAIALREQAFVASAASWFRDMVSSKLPSYPVHDDHLQSGIDFKHAGLLRAC